MVISVRGGSRSGGGRGRIGRDREEVEVGRGGRDGEEGRDGEGGGWGGEKGGRVTTKESKHHISDCRTWGYMYML